MPGAAGSPAAVDGGDCDGDRGDAASTVASDEIMMHLVASLRASTRKDALRLVLKVEVFRRVGTLLSTSFDAGVDLRDVQIAARYADPRTTMRYDGARKNLDRHPNYILAAYLASGT